MPNLRAYLTALLLLAAMVGSAPAATTAPIVVASISPPHSLIAAIMQDVETPHLLLQGRESPHTFSLRPSEARLLNQADLLFWIGPGLEQPLARILPNTDLRRSVALIEASGITLLLSRGNDRDSHDHDRAHGPTDPHIWPSPGNAAAMAREIARRLVTVDPTRADLYRRNTERLITRLDELDHDIRARPGAAHLRELPAELRARRVSCLFSEPQFQSNLVTMLSDQLDIRHAELDPLDSDIPPGPTAYEKLMHAMADTISDCMRGENK